MGLIRSGKYVPDVSNAFTLLQRVWIIFMLALALLVTGFSASVAQDVVTQQEIEKAREIRNKLNEQGLIVTDTPVGPLSIDIGNSRLLDFASYTGRRISTVEGNDNSSNPRAIEFHKDGTKMYIVRRSAEKISEYKLGTPWDVRSAELSGELSLSALNGDSDQAIFAAHGIFIRKSDGKKLWVFNRTEIWEYDLESAWDITTAENPRYESFKDEVVRGHDFDFSADGRNLFIDDRIAALVYHFRLSTPWDVSTASLSNTLNFSSRVSDQEVRGTQFSESGDRMFLLDTENSAIYEYYLSSNFDLSTARYIDSYNLGNQASSPYGMVFSSDFTRFYISDGGTQNIYQYKISVVDADESAITSNRTKVVANGSATARISVTARDRDDKEIAGARITLRADDNDVNIQNTRRVTNNSGVATFDVSHTNEEVVEFRASGMGVTINERVEVEFTTVDQNESSITINREKVLANGEAGATVTVTARDKDGDVLEGVDFTLSAQGNTDIEIDDSNSTTDSDGEAEFIITSRSYGVTDFQAEGLGVELSGISVRFVDVDPDESDVITESRKVLANGAATGIITVIARDEDGDELEGAPVRLRSDSDHMQIENSTIVTNSDGEARFEIRSDQTGTANFYAEATGNRLSQEVQLQYVTVDPAQTLITVNPKSVQANGEEESILSVTARDEDGDVLSGARVEVDALNGSSHIEEENLITDEDGNARFQITNDRPQIVRYKITAENIEIPEHAEIAFIPIAPVALSATSVENREMTANWEVVDGVEYYLLDVATDSSFTEVLPDYNSHNTGNRTSYIIDNISPGTTYMYRVRGVSDGLTGANSQTITTTTFPDTPVVAQATDRNALQFTANWNEAEGAREYRIDVAEDPEFQKILPAYSDHNAGLATSVTITGLDPGIRYYYRVRSKAGPRTSINSDITEATTLTISNDLSEKESEQLRVLANGVQANPVYITVKSEEGILLRDLPIDVVLVEGDARIEAVQETTNEEGVAVFHVSSHTAGKAVFNVSVVGIDLGPLSVEFLPDGGVLDLGQNYPNPFLNNTTIPVTVPGRMNIHLQVYNAIGIPVQTVVDEEFETGYYEVPFHGNGLAAGVYFIRLTADGEAMTSKMVLVK